MADTPKHSVSVAGIVVDDQDRVLVIQRRDNGHWEPPGGVLELNETPEEGVKREIVEETGVEVDVLGLSGVYENMSRGIVALVFRCRVHGGAERISDEASSLEWLPLGRAVARMDEAYSVRLSDAFSEYVEVRVHDGVSLLSKRGQSEDSMGSAVATNG